MQPAKRARLDEAGHRSEPVPDQDGAAAAATPVLSQPHSAGPSYGTTGAAESRSALLASIVAVEVEAALPMRQHPLLQHALVDDMRQLIYTTKLVQLRRRALIPALLVQSLFYLPSGERLRAGQVNKEWRVAVQHPSLWARRRMVVHALRGRRRCHAAA